VLAGLDVPIRPPDFRPLAFRPSSLGPLRLLPGCLRALKAGPLRVTLSHRPLDRSPSLRGTQRINLISGVLAQGSQVLRVPFLHRPILGGPILDGSALRRPIRGHFGRRGLVRIAVQLGRKRRLEGVAALAAPIAGPAGSVDGRPAVRPADGARRTHASYPPCLWSGLA